MVTESSASAKSFLGSFDLDFFDTRVNGVSLDGLDPSVANASDDIRIFSLFSVIHKDQKRSYLECVKATYLLHKLLQLFQSLLYLWGLNQLLL